MTSIKIIDALFCVGLYLLVLLYYVSARRERLEESFREANVLLMGGVGYILMLFYNLPKARHQDEVFYLFALITLFIALKLINFNKFSQDIVPPKMYLSIMGFAVLWVLIGVNRDHSFYDIMFPIMAIQAVIFFFIGLIYLMYEEFAMSMRNLSGFLFAIMTVVKICYIIQFQFSHSEKIWLFYSIDFVLYSVLCFVVIVFEYNQNTICSNMGGKKKVQTMTELPIGVVQLTPRADIISMNEVVKERLEEIMGESGRKKLPNFHEITKVPVDDTWQEILEYAGRGSSYTIEGDILNDGKHERLEMMFMPNSKPKLGEENLTSLTCFIMRANRHHSLLSSGSDDSIKTKVIPNKYQMMEIFNQIVSYNQLQHFGVILIKIVNYDRLTHIVNAHETSTIDQLVYDKLSKLNFIHTIGKVGQNTFEIYTVELVVENEIHTFIDSIKEELNCQNFYDNQMNVYNLDYRVGVSLVPDDGMTQRDLLRNCTIAVAKARNDEKGAVQFYNENVKTEVLKGMQLETKLRDGIVSEQLFLEYQPQFNPKDESIRGFEALVRWRLPNGNVMMPTEFIDASEEVGVIDELGEWVLRTALVQGLLWNKRYNKNWILSVNVSVYQLEHDGFSDMVISILEETGYPSEFLELEVTETKMAKSSDRVFLELSKLKDYGIKIAIDDFGTGYSSLSYLRLLPFDLLKIDKGFIERISTHEVDIKILESILDLVNKMDLESVAEGVETKEQLEFLRRTNCNYVQGYVYSRPMSKDAVIDLIEEAM